MLKITRPCWILTSPRSGSTYLCDLLNSTNLFGGKFTKDPPRKKVDRWTEYTSIYYNKLFGVHFLENPPVINKMHYWDRINYWDQINHYNNDEVIRDIVYVKVSRENLYEVTVSKYISMQTQKWNIRSENELKDFQKLTFEFNEKQIIRLHEETKICHNGWNDFLSNKEHLVLTYENIVNNPQLAVQTILKAMGFKGSADLNHVNLPRKIKHRQKEDFEKELQKIDTFCANKVQ